MRAPGRLVTDLMNAAAVALEERPLSLASAEPLGSWACHLASIPCECSVWKHAANRRVTITVLDAIRRSLFGMEPQPAEERKLCWRHNGSVPLGHWSPQQQSAAQPVGPEWLCPRVVARVDSRHRKKGPFVYLLYRASLTLSHLPLQKTI